MYYCRYAIFCFLGRDCISDRAYFFSLFRGVYCFLVPLPGFFLSPCHLVSTRGGKAYTWHISSIIFAPTQKLVNGSWYVSIVPLMIFFICAMGLGTGARCGQQLHIWDFRKKTSGLYIFYLNILHLS